MDEQVRRALETDRVIDITTTGRKSGQPRRIEIWFRYLDGRVYITGRPGRRSWYANLVASPAFTFHVKQSAQADLAARARPIVDQAERRELFGRLLQGERAAEVPAWVAGAPLVEVEFEP